MPYQAKPKAGGEQNGARTTQNVHTGESMGSVAREIQTQMSQEAASGEMVGRFHILSPEHAEIVGSSEGQREPSE